MSCPREMFQAADEITSQLCSQFSAICNLQIADLWGHGYTPENW
jgi:hypothetical protein